MIKCKECGKDFSDTASACPHCGHANIPPVKNKNKGCLKVFFFLLGFTILAYFISQMNSTPGYTSSTSVQSDTDSNSNSIESSKEIMPVVDSARLKELKKLFTEKKDEFENTTWIRPKSRPQYINQNCAYLYFSKSGNTAENLRFVLQYAADDWLFVKDAQFIVDGKNFDYNSGRWNTDHDSGIWEWSDESASQNAALIYAIADAKNVKYRLSGNTYYKDKTLSSTYIKSIKNTLEYYKLLGGKL